MSSHDRRAAARCRAWGRGPIILRFEPLEGRQLLAATPTPLPDLVGASLTIPQTIDWGKTFEGDGDILNQGHGTATAPFNVQFFASSTPNLGPKSVSLGAITIPAGLGPGQDAPFQAHLTLPETPIPGAADNQPIYIALWVDPEGAVAESNKNNNHGVGMGYDTSAITITPPLPANLVGSTLGVFPQQAFWGTPITITAQVKNNAQGDAPATRAKITLTPAGVQPGGPADVTIGYLNIPAIPAWQAVNISQTIALPQVPPSMLAGSTSFTLSMIQDADDETDILYPHQATQGLGLDQAQIAIGPNPNTNVSQAPLPDLAADGVQAPTQPIYWGQTFQVTTGVDNFGPGAAGPFDVRFLLTGAGGSLDHSIYLGDVDISGLGRNMHQDIAATLRLPNRFPNGVTLDSVGVGRIAVVIDPDNTIDETLKTNNISESNPVTLRLLGSDGSTTVPTLPADTTPTPTLGTPTPAGTVQKKLSAAAKARPHKLYRHIKPQHASLTSKVEHRLKIFPKQVNNFVSDLIHGKGAGSINVNKLLHRKDAGSVNKKT